MKRRLFVFGLALASLTGYGVSEFRVKAPYRIDVKPGESLTAVRDRVRALDAAQRGNGVEVRLPPGTYVLPQALTLGKGDSGTEGAPVVWRAADPKDRPHLVGGDAIPASAFKPVEDPELVARLDPEARGKVLETDISGIRFAWPKPQKIPCELRPPLKVPDVFAGGRRLTLASFPSEGWSEIVKITDRGAGYGDRTLASALAQGVIKPEDIYGGTFVYREDRPSRWAAHPEVAIEGFWRYDWRNTIIYAKAIDPQAKTITLGAAHSYRLGQGNPAPRRWRALNVFEELNRPGRYAVDFAKRRLYVYPPAGFDGVGVCSSSDPLVRMKDVHDVVLKGLHFGRSAGSGLVLDGTERVIVTHCEFTDARQVAVAASDCRRCEVRTCDFHRLCGGGIRLSGGDRRTLEPGNNLIEDCLFHHWNALSATAMAVNVGGVGNAVRHCVMRDTSHQAAGISGNDCVFEYNVLSNICTGTDDAGAFYKGRNPSAQGNVLRYNYFRNIGRQEIRNGHGSCAVYFDDGDCGETVFGNVFENAGVAGFGNFAAVFSHGGHSNVVRNCLFLDCQRALGSGPWTQKRWAEFLKSDKDAFPVVTRLRKEVDVTKPPYTTHYPSLVGFFDPQPDEYRWNAAYDNAFVNCPLSLPDAQGQLTKPGLVAGRWRTNETSVVIEGDPGFVNRAAGDLRLRSDSPIYRKIPGFRPIPFEKIGLLTPRESSCNRLQSYVHGLAAKDGRYVAEFNLGRTRTKACAPVTFRWRGEAGAQYAVSVNGHALGVVSGETCAVVAEAAHVGRDPNRLSIDVVAGCDTALTNENRIAVFITVPAEKGPRLSEREFLDRLALPIDTSDVQEGARQFVRYVRENYRIEPEIREKQTRRLAGNDLGKALDLGKCAVDYRFKEVGVWYDFPDRRIQWQFNPTRNGYREWCFHLACFRLSNVLATYYVQSDDERAAETWRDVCLSFFEDEPLPDGDPGYDTNSWRSLDTAERLMHLMTDLPVFLKSPAITDEFLLVFFRSMWEHGYRLRTAHAGRGNWLTNEMTVLYRFSWVMPYFKESEEWRSYALARIVKELNGQVYPDGHQYELAGGYHACVARQFLRIPAVSRFAGTEPPAEVMRTVERMFEPYMALARPDGRIPGLNDSGDASVVPFLSEGAALFPARQDMRWFASGGKEGRRPDWLSRPLPYAGAAVMRTSWAKDAIWAYMDCGPLGTAHQHEDKLNVLVFAYGHKLLSEGGFYDYDTSEMRKYVLSTRSHNTVRIDGCDQNRLRGYRWHPEDIAKKAEMEFRTTDALDVAAAKYAEPYAGNSKSGLAHERRLMFFKSVPGVSPFFAVIDRLSATDGKEHAYEQIWHLNDGKLDRQGRSDFLATYPGGSALAGLCSDAAAEIVDKAGQRTPELQGWNPGVWSRNNATPIATPVVCGRFVGARRIVTVLQPLRKASEPMVRAVRASADSADKAFELELSDGRIVALSE